jgi:hypothetical protein
MKQEKYERHVRVHVKRRERVDEDWHAEALLQQLNDEVPPNSSARWFVALSSLPGAPYKAVVLSYAKEIYPTSIYRSDVYLEIASEASTLDIYLTSHLLPGRAQPERERKIFQTNTLKMYRLQHDGCHHEQ